MLNREIASAAFSDDAAKKLTPSKSKKKSPDSTEKNPNRSSSTKRRKTLKPAVELDLERHCAVLTDNGPCLRALTCKSHSVGAKRAVAGRSNSFDVLLGIHHSKNQMLKKSMSRSDSVTSLGLTN